MELQYERLVRSLEELLAAGSERFAREPDAQLHDRAQLYDRAQLHNRAQLLDRAQLQQQHSSHTVSLWDIQRTSRVFGW